MAIIQLILSLIILGILYVRMIRRDREKMRVAAGKMRTLQISSRRK